MLLHARTLGINQAVLAGRKMKWPVGKLTTSCLLCIRQLKGEMLVPSEAALERNCAARSEQRGGTSKLGLVQPPMPTRPRTPPGVGTPLQAAGRPGQRHPPKNPASPLANANGGALQSLVDRSALMVASHLITFNEHSTRQFFSAALVLHLFGKARNASSPKFRCRSTSCSSCVAS